MHLKWSQGRAIFVSCLMLGLGACATYERTVYLKPDTGVWVETKGWGPHYFIYNCPNYRIYTPAIHVYSSAVKYGPIYPAFPGRPEVNARRNKLKLDIRVSGDIAEDKADFERLTVLVMHNGQLLEPIERLFEFYSEQEFFNGIYTFALDIDEVEAFDVEFNQGPKGCDIPRLHYRKVSDNNYGLFHLGI